MHAMHGACIHAALPGTSAGQAAEWLVCDAIPDVVCVGKKASNASLGWPLQ
jgi:hypothetical protein